MYFFLAYLKPARLLSFGLPSDNTRQLRARVPFTQQDSSMSLKKNIETKCKNVSKTRTMPFSK